MPIFYPPAVALLYLHEQVIREFGGSGGLRDRGALEGAAARPRATFGGHPLYATLPEKAAALLESICVNHPFVDGNKRVAFSAAGLFLQYNGRTLACEEDEAVEFMLGVAAGKLRKEEIRIWLQEHSRPL
ncbi:MAG: type II toxin-antitoxin system death-on-curing family toxin [Planctomycetes bacterium]|nr:type II toxin-antitoxin system death-on-curing family toxin [Planctomycetota bacterium]